jgi:hypothetical protein
MFCRKNEETQCCIAADKDKVIPCVLAIISVIFVIAGIILGHKFMCKDEPEEF